MTRASASLWVRLGLLALVLSLAVVSEAVTAHTTPAAAPCTPLHTDSAYTDAVLGALASNKDVWGNDVLASPEGRATAGDAARLQELAPVRRMIFTAEEA